MDTGNEPQERDRISELKYERIQLQQKTFTKWINAFLEKHGQSVNNIFSDLADGSLLIKLLESISGDKIGNALRGKQRIYKIENVSRVLEYLKKHVKLESIGPEDVVDGKEELILGLIWTIILRFSIKEIQDGGSGKTIKDSLLVWCQRMTKGYAGVDIKNFTSSWKNGLAFNALIHAHRPDLFNYQSLNGQQHIKNLEHAFNIAEDKLGIKRILDPQDIDVPRPDEKSIMAYVALMYQYFAKMKSEKTGGKRLIKFMKELLDIDELKVSYEALVNDLLQWIQTKTQHLKKPLPDIFEGLQKEIKEFKKFRNTEKPARYSQCIEIEAQFLSIQSQLQANQYRTYVPSSGRLLNDIQKAWKVMENVEYERDAKIRNELLRHDKISQLLKRFGQKAKLRENWLCDMQKVCDSEKNIRDIPMKEIDTNLKRLQGIDTDIKAQKIRISKLVNLVEEIKCLNYYNSTSIEKRVSGIESQWSHVSKKIIAKKKSLSSLQNISSIVEDIENLNLNLDQINLSLESQPKQYNLLVIESLTQTNKHQLLNVVNHEIHLNSIEQKILVSLRPNHPHAEKLDALIQNTANKIKNIEETLTNQKSSLSDSKILLDLKDNFLYQHSILKEKKQLACLPNYSLNPSLCGAQEIQQKNLITEVDNCETQCQSLFKRVAEIQTLLSSSSAEVNDCHVVADHVRDELIKVKEKVDTKSIWVLLMSAEYKFKMNLNEGSLWVNDKTSELENISSSHSLPQVKDFLKRLKKIARDIKAFENEVKFLTDQYEDFADVIKNNWKLFLEKATVRETYKNNNDIQLMKGENVYIQPTSTANTWKVYQGDNILELPIQRTTKEEHQQQRIQDSLKVTSHGFKLKCYGLTKVLDNAEDYVIQTMNGYQHCFQSYQRLKDKLVTVDLHLNQSKDYYLFEENGNEFINWTQYILKYITEVDLKGELHIVQRKMDKIKKEIDIHKNVLEDLVIVCEELIGEQPHKQNELVAMRNNMEKLMFDIVEKHDLLGKEVNKVHGYRIFKDHCDHLQSLIKEKKQRLCCDLDFSNLNAVRRAQRSFQDTQREVAAIKLGSSNLDKDFPRETVEDNINVSRDDLLRNVKDLETLCQDRGTRLAALYGFHGFIADSDEVLNVLSQKKELFEQIEIPENLDELEQSNEVLANLMEEVEVPMENLNDLIKHGETLVQDGSSSNISEHLKKLKNLNTTINETIHKKKDGIINKRKELQCTKQLLKTTEVLKTINQSLDDLDFQRDILSTPSSALFKEYERIECVLDMEQGKIPQCGSNKLYDDVYKLHKETKAKLTVLCREAVELQNFEQFVDESNGLLASIQDKLTLVDLDEVIDVRNLTRKLKDHDALKSGLNTLGMLKDKLDEKGSFFLEDCHFASSQISDQMELMETQWGNLLHECQRKDEKLKTLATKNHLQLQCKDLNDSLRRINKKLGQPPRVDSLSSAKKMLSENKALTNDISKHLSEVKDLIGKSKETGNSDFVESAEMIHQQFIQSGDECNSQGIVYRNLYNLHQFLIQAHMEVSWITEQTALLDNLKPPSSTTEALSVEKSLKVLQKQFISHKSCLQSFLENGEMCLNNDQENSGKIRNEQFTVKRLWEELNKKLAEKDNSFKKQKQVLQYVDEADVYLDDMDSKLILAMNNEYGNDLTSLEIALKKHDKLQNDVSQYKRKLKRFVRELSVIEDGSNRVKNIGNAIKNKYKKLELCCAHRMKMLQNTHDLLSLFSEADTVRAMLNDVSSHIPEDIVGKSYEEINESNQRFKQVRVSFQSIQKPYEQFMTRADELVTSSHPHSANILKMKVKVENVHQRMLNKIETMEKKLLKSLQYHTFNFKVNNVIAALDETNNKINKFHANFLKLESVPALKEELRQVEHTINESKHMKDQIKGLADDLAKLSQDFPGKNIQKLGAHLKAVKSHYTSGTKKLKEIQMKYKMKICTLTFDSDVHHLDGWLVNVKEELIMAQETAVDFASTQASFTEAELKSKELDLKLKAIEDLQATVASLATSIQPTQSQKMAETLERISLKHENVKQYSNDCTKYLQEKLQRFQVFRDISSARNALISLQERVHLNKTTNISFETRSRKLDEYQRILHAQNTRIKQIEEDQHIRNQASESEVEQSLSKSLDELCCEEREVRKLLKQQRKELAASKDRSEFQHLYTEVLTWLNDTIYNLSQESTNNNLKIAVRKLFILNTEVYTYEEKFMKIKELQRDASVTTTSAMNEIKNLWMKMTNLKEKRGKDLEEGNTINEYKQTIALIDSHMNDQIAFLNTQLADEPRDGVQIHGSAMETVKVSINKYAKQINDLTNELENTVPKYPNLSSHVTPLVNRLVKKLEEVRKLYEKGVTQQEQGMLIQNFKAIFEELLNKIKKVGAILNKTPVCIDQKSIRFLLKEQTSIQSDIGSLIVRKDDLRNLVVQIMDSSDRVNCDKNLLGIEQQLSVLIETAKRRKLTLEAQSKLHMFLEDTSKLTGWLSSVSTRLENQIKLDHKHDQEMETLLRTLNELKLELNVKKDKISSLSELGQSLVQDGQLSSMEVESRLGDIKAGFKKFEFDLNSSEKALYQNVSAQELKRKYSTLLAWLQKQVDYLHSFQIGRTEEALYQVKRELTVLQSKMEKQRSLVHDLKNILKNQVFDDVTSCGELEENFELLDFLFDEKVKEMESQEELFKLVTNYTRVLAWTRDSIRILENFNAKAPESKQTIFSISQNINGHESMIHSICNGMETCDNSNFLQENRLDSNLLIKIYNELKEKYEVCNKAMGMVLTESSIINDLETIDKSIDDTDKQISHLGFCVDKIGMSETKQDLIEIREIMTSLNDHLHEIREKSKNNEIANEIISRIQSTSKRLTLLGKQLCDKENSLVKKNETYLQLVDDIEKEEFWMSLRRWIVEDESIPVSRHDMMKISKDLQNVEEEFSGRKEHFHSIKETLTSLSKDNPYQDFCTILSKAVDEFTMTCETFEKKLQHRVQAVKDISQIHEVAERCEHLLPRFEELHEISQDISTGEDEASALTLLQKNESHKTELVSCNRNTEILQQRYDDIVVFESFKSELGSKVSELFNNLTRLQDEVNHNMKLRHSALAATHQFFKFKSELTFLDRWIQEQIAHIKTEGIGSTVEECDYLMKETEAFARNLMAREERVRAFGVLSHELMQRHPTGKILKNTSNIYEMWNDVKDLLQTRLETLEKGFVAHAYREKVIALTNCLKGVGSRVDSVEIRLNELGDLTGDAKQLMEQYNDQFTSINSRYEELLQEKRFVDMTIDQCKNLVEPELVTLGNQSKSLEILMSAKKNCLRETMDIDAFTKQLCQMLKWIDATIIEVESNIDDIAPDSRDKLNRIQNEHDSYQQYYSDLLEKRESGFVDLSETNLEVLTKHWFHFDSRWQKLRLLLKQWREAVNSTKGLKNIMNDFEAIERWIDEQERRTSAPADEEVGEELEYALCNQIELEEYLKIQDEKIQSVCNKVDTFENRGVDLSITPNQNLPTGVNKLSKEMKQQNTLDKNNNRNVTSSPLNETHQTTNDEHLEIEQEVFGKLNDDERRKTDELTSSQTKILVGLLKKTRCPSDPKKRVVFSTSHEFSDCSGTIQTFSKLNDEYVYHYDDDDVSDDDDVIGDGWDDDYIIFSPEAPSPPNYPAPPDQFTMNFNDSEDDDDDNEVWGDGFTEVEATMFDTPPTPSIVEDNKFDLLGVPPLDFLNYSDEVESDVYFTDSDEDDDTEESERIYHKLPPPTLFTIEEVQ